MSNVSQTHVASTKQAFAYPFYLTDIADANGTLMGQATTPEYIAPYKGSIIGFSGTLNGTLTTGTLTLQPTIDGSLCPAFTESGALLHLNQNGAYYTQDARKANYQFDAGARLGFIYQKASTVAPTTRDGNFTLIVLHEGVQY